jgi:hypothetical protein
VEGRPLDTGAALEPSATEMAGPAREALDARRAHAYEVAARLCAGHEVADLACGDGLGSQILARRAAAVVGVDPDRAAIRAARLRAEGTDALSFEVSGVLEFLRRERVEELGSIVVLRPIEAEEREEALAILRARAEVGAGLVLTFEDESSGERGQLPAAFEGLSRLTVLQQLAADGSLIRPRDADGVAGAEVEELEPAPDEGAAPGPPRLIACVNLDPGPVASARLALRPAPAHEARLRGLERANLELRRVNASLAHSRLGKRDSAAASVLAELQSAQTRIESMERSASWRLTAPLRALSPTLGPLKGRLARMRARVRARLGR